MRCLTKMIVFVEWDCINGGVIAINSRHKGNSLQLMNEDGVGWNNPILMPIEIAVYYVFF